MQREDTILSWYFLWDTKFEIIQLDQFSLDIESEM